MQDLSFINSGVEIVLLDRLVLFYVFPLIYFFFLFISIIGLAHKHL